MLARKIEGEKAAEARHDMSKLLLRLHEHVYLGQLHLQCQHEVHFFIGIAKVGHILFGCMIFRIHTFALDSGS